MKKYKVRFSEKSIKDLKQIDKKMAIMIKLWIIQNLEGTNNPKLYGKPLSGNHKGKWRYRVGNYRILANIVDDEIIILILKIGHRKEIYKN